MNNMNPVLRCEKLGKTYQDGALSVNVFNDIDLIVPAGANIAIMGASGSGKSTLLHLLGGLDKVSAGQVYWNDLDIATLNESARCRLRNQHLGFIYQLHHLLPEFTALENTMLPLLLAKQAHHIATKEAMTLLDAVGLTHRYQHKVAELSGGERQRVAIARALVTKPRCILADEPTGNLDNDNAAKVFALMLQLSRELHTSLVMVTHDAHLANQFDRIYDLSAKGLVAQG